MKQILPMILTSLAISLTGCSSTSNNSDQIALEANVVAQDSLCLYFDKIKLTTSMKTLIVDNVQDMPELRKDLQQLVVHNKLYDDYCTHE